jgi:hypothetical protein
MFCCTIGNNLRFFQQLVALGFLLCGVKEEPSFRVAVGDDRILVSSSLFAADRKAS